MGSGRAEDRGPLEGRYANFFKVGHNAYEIIIEFGQLYAEEAAPRIHSRIITSPAYARELLETLRQTVEENEGKAPLKDSKA